MINDISLMFTQQQLSANDSDLPEQRQSSIWIGLQWASEVYFSLCLTLFLRFQKPYLDLGSSSHQKVNT